MTSLAYSLADGVLAVAILISPRLPVIGAWNDPRLEMTPGSFYPSVHIQRPCLEQNDFGLVSRIGKGSAMRDYFGPCGFQMWRQK